jgi:hypothetical protein
MKKGILFSIIGVVVLGIIFLSLWKGPKKLDQRVTLRERDKIPYGFYAARKLLPTLFPKATIKTDRALPGEWKGIDFDDSAQAVIIVAPAIYATEDELNTLVSFVQKGNYVFFITPFLNSRTEELFNVSSSVASWQPDTSKQFQVALQAPRFANQQYSYPGRNRGRYFDKWDSSQALVLGSYANGKPNFLQVSSMSGAFYIHYAPLAFSNYFILHKKNHSYYEQVLSVLPSHIKKIVWNEYYMSRTREGGGKEKEPNMLRVLFRYDSFKWGLLTAMAMLALYMLSEARRRQRYIPTIPAIKNESLDFVKTIGLLYYDKGDHHDLATKMGRHFLEHVRQQYKIQTDRLDEDFVQTLQAKSGHPHRNVDEIIGFIRYLDEVDAISPGQLTDFYNNLQRFYKTS